jgi:hypothetical protein
MIKRLENVIDTVFHYNHREELIEWIQKYEDVLTKLIKLGQKTSNDEEIKKNQLL